MRHSRRDLLKMAAAAAAGAGGATISRAAGTGAFAGIDAALQAATDAGEVPGIVATAATDKGIVYEGAFGKRDLAGSAMTRDTIFTIASMTKAITSVAAMQLVEQGKLALDEPVPDIDPALSAPQVLTGFDGAGMPQLRPAKRPITLRHLLTHTAGFTYEMWDANTLRYQKAVGGPGSRSRMLDGIRTPLAFDPGERWEYGVNTDWVGRIVEAVSGQPLDAYFRAHILDPLGMADTAFIVPPAGHARQASIYTRKPDGSLAPMAMGQPSAPAYFSGGGGLFSTAPDYLAFTRMLLNGGSLGNARILRQETVALMSRNNIGALKAGTLKTAMPEMTNDVDLFPGANLKWGLGTMINMQPGPNGRRAGTLTWAGLFNTYYWIDPASRVTGVFMTQILPFADLRALDVFGRFERGVYDAVKAG